MTPLIDPVHHEAIIASMRETLPKALAACERSPFGPLSENERDIFALAYALGVADGIAEAQRIYRQ